MALTNAERQKLYRERQKNKNKDEYLKKEAKRKRDTYTPSCMLSPAALTQRREESCSKFKKHYYKKKKILENDQNKDPLPSTSTAPLIVQLPSIKKHNFRKTYRRSLMKAYRSNKELLHKKSTLEKKRSGNSTTLPGKRDTKTVKKEVKQKHVLNDYMMNLYEKYKFENPGIKMSRTCFYKLRPSHVILADFANRRTCLYTRHPNMSLKIKALCNLGLRLSKNPDVIIKAHETNGEILAMIDSLEITSVKYFNWKRVDDGNKMRYKEVEENVGKQAFIEQFD